MVGVKSSARRLGAGVRSGVGIFYVLAVVMAAAAGAAAGLGLLFAIGVVGYAVHLAVQVWRLRPGEATLALRLFRSNRQAGLILLVAIAAGGLQWV